MRISFNGHNKSIINTKSTLIVFSAMLLVGIVLSVVQITIAGVTGPHNPGHTWATIDKPADCSAGYYVYGANDSGWLCGTLPVDTDTWITTQTCPGGQYLSSVGKTTKVCSTPSGGTSYWTLSPYNDLYPTGTDNIMVVVGDSTSPYTGARLSVNAGLGTGTPATFGIDSRGQVAGGYFQNMDIYGNDTGARAFLGYKTGSYYYGVYALGGDAGGYFKDDNGSTYTNVAAGSYSIYGNGIIYGSSKQFGIDHPTKLGMKLVHASIEGPENGVYYRGESQLVNGRTDVYLPDYFEALVQEGNRTVLLTPKFEKEDELISQLAASSVLNGKFTVRAIDNNNPSQKFYWEVKAVRDDLLSLEVEQPAENFPESIK